MKQVPTDTDVQKELDVQMYANGTMITVPGGMMIGLSHDDADTLGHMLTEARLNRHGLQPVSVPADNIQVGDILPGFGLTVNEVNTTSVGVFVFFTDDSSLKLAHNIEITVNRRIS